jgi:hypothetical protein
MHIDQNSTPEKTLENYILNPCLAQKTKTKYKIKTYSNN